MSEVIYLAGPMSGIAEFNYPAFAKYAKKYRDLGYEVTSPHELDLADGTDPGKDNVFKIPWAEYLKRDLMVMLMRNVTSIYLLPGWEGSRGARLEHHVGSELGFGIYLAETGERHEPSVA